MSEEDLFGDIFDSFPSVGTTHTPNPRKKHIDNAWEQWTRLTNRPVAGVPDKFSKAVEALLDNKYSIQEMTSRIEAAAYLEPHSRDPRDLGRVCNSLTSDSVALKAIGVMESEHTEIIEWVNEELSLKMTFSELSRIIGVPMDDWVSSDLDHARDICLRFSERTVIPIVENVKNKLGMDLISPYDVMRNRDAWRGDLKASERKGRDAYHAGSVETNAVEDLMLDLDPAAENMHLRGKPLDQVRTFHNQVPSGYWSFLDEFLETRPELSVEEGYDMISSSFSGWHPDHRKADK